MANCVLACLFATGVMSSIADAGDSVRDAAKAHYELGQALYNKGSYFEARVEFLAAFELSKRPALLFNAAECARLAGDAEAARIDYDRYLEADPSGKLAPLAKERLAGLVAKPEPTPEPRSAPKPEPPGSPTASVAQPSADGVTRNVVAPSLQPRTDRRWLGYAAGGVGAAALGVGVAFGLHARSLGNDVHDDCVGTCEWSLVADRDAAGRRAEKIQFVMYGVSAAAFIAGVVLYVRGRPSNVAVAPTEGVGGAVTWNVGW